MPSPIGPIAPASIARIADVADIARVRPGDRSVDFGEALGDAFERAGSAERTAQTSAVRFAAGDPSVGIHEVVIATEKANLAVRYATTLKNKLLEAYKEIMNTPV